MDSEDVRPWKFAHSSLFLNPSKHTWSHTRTTLLSPNSQGPTGSLTHFFCVWGEQRDRKTPLLVASHLRWNHAKDAKLAKQRERRWICVRLWRERRSEPGRRSAPCFQKVSPFKKVTCSHATRERKNKKRGRRGSFYGSQNVLRQSEHYLAQSVTPIMSPSLCLILSFLSSFSLKVKKKKMTQTGFRAQTHQLNDIRSSLGSDCLRVGKMNEIVAVETGVRNRNVCGRWRQNETQKGEMRDK